MKAIPREGRYPCLDLALNESIHLVGLIGFAVLAVKKFASDSLTALGLTVALVLNLILGLWPVVLQRYNRLRLYRVINRRSSLAAKLALRARDGIVGSDGRLFLGYGFSVCVPRVRRGSRIRIRP
jgi:hypothetical protein